MSKEKIISKVSNNWEERKSFILCGRCIICRNIFSENTLKAKQASFLFEADGKRYEINYGEDDINKSDEYDLIIFPFSKHRVAVKNQTVHSISSKWLIGGFNSDNDDMKILGYMDFGTVSMMIYFNSETETPFIILEDWQESGEAKLLYQAFHSLLSEKKKEGADADEFDE